MKPTKLAVFSTLLILFTNACTNQNSNTKASKLDTVDTEQPDQEEKPKLPKTADDIKLVKELLYDQYTLEDNYPYKDTSRFFQWEKIKDRLAYVENFQQSDIRYAVLQNYRNGNKEAPVVANFVRNAYTRVSDTLGVERYQSAPLYHVGAPQTPIIYGRDGSLVKLLSSDTLDMVKIEGISFEGIWEVPKRYVKVVGDTQKFNHIVFVDVTNQNTCTVEQADSGWLIRSMNPATTGRHKPPHAQETPTGIFLIQEQKPKMYYHKDGTKEIGGFAPYASRFTNGAYIHGIPVNKPRTEIIEYGQSLGTTPRSHMCVRNASSHAKYIYEWAKPFQSLVIVID